jgi:beta-glucosidase-like glycosyl hydrolase
MRFAVPVVLALTMVAQGFSPAGRQLDRSAEQWVQRTLKSMTLEQKVGQLLMPSFESTFLSSDSDEFDRLSRLVREQHVGGFLVFGGSEPAPSVLLNPTYGTVTLGQPLAAASTLNRLQGLAAIPLLNAADFEGGPGFRIAGAIGFPRAMAFGAAGDPELARRAGRAAGAEARAMGIHVSFAPVADVNNNPRNPVINTRSYGEDPARVGALASAWVRGLAEAGELSTLKHFPGHGDTDVDTHLGLATIAHPRARLDAVELAPFRDAIAAGADAVMVAHIAMPTLDAVSGRPATLSPPVVTDLLRKDLGFDGLVYTDSLHMQAIAVQMDAGEAAVRAIEAGNDVVLHSPDDRLAFAALVRAAREGRIPGSRVEQSALRILRAKARLGLHRTRVVDLETLPAAVGTRAHHAIADEVSRRGITLLRDERDAVPLRLPAGAQVLYLSVLDYPGGWRIAAPSRTFIPELRKRVSGVTAIELSDRSTREEIELVRAMAPRFDAVVAGVFVRAASASGRLDLTPALAGLLTQVAGAATDRPVVAVLFGNPYTAITLRELPAVLLAYDFYDRAERSAVRALFGEAPIGGRLPIALPGLFPVGHGLDEAVVPESPK